MRVAVMTIVGLMLHVGASNSFAQLSYGQNISASYERDLNVAYLQLGGWSARLDVYARRDAPGPHPTIIYFHGGGALGADGGRTASTIDLVPYLEWGWNVVNVEWGVPGLTLAPVAYQNARCAVRWVASNSEKYGFDKDRLVTTGFSSGGWLALLTAIAPPPAGWDACPTLGDAKVAAVVNWSGMSDLVDVLDGPNARAWARDWLQTLPNAREIAKTVSPLTYLRASQPPVISVHGDADPIVPYQQAVRLHAALKRLGVHEQLVTVNGGGHGLNRDQTQGAFAAVRAFLASLGMEVSLGPDND